MGRKRQGRGEEDRQGGGKEKRKQGEGKEERREEVRCRGGLPSSCEATE